MSTITTTDGTRIAFNDRGTGQPILFSHGWPLAGDAWNARMLFFGQNGYRVIAHDRRGHGKSDQPWNGNNMDQYAGDLAELIEKLDLSNLALVGHSTGGGEVVHYIGRHGSKRVAKVVLIGAVPPLMLKTARQYQQCSGAGTWHSIVILSAAGSIFIMVNLNEAMMPAPEMMNMPIRH
jgi:non-heme chloroperoxidase